jgi:carbamoyltransferase
MLTFALTFLPTRTSMNILGISAYYHDSAAALVRDGAIVAAAQEERFTRKKHDYRFPRNAIDYCLREAQIGRNDLDLVVFYDKPLMKFERILETYVSYSPAGFKLFLVAFPAPNRDSHYPG